MFHGGSDLQLLSRCPIFPVQCLIVCCFVFAGVLMPGFSPGGKCGDGEEVGYISGGWSAEMLSFRRHLKNDSACCTEAASR